MGQPIKEITIEGFKSIRQLEAFPLGSLNVLIGANGAGKSNFVDFFRLLRAIAGDRLQYFTNKNGGSDSFLFMGPSVTDRIRAGVSFGDHNYLFELEPTVAGGLIFETEVVTFSGNSLFAEHRGERESTLVTAQLGLFDSEFKSEAREAMYKVVSSSSVYHFNDTSSLSPVRRQQSTREYERLREDGSNVAAYLMRLGKDRPDVYEAIRFAVGLVVPAFRDFRFRVEDTGGKEQVRLEWSQNGTDYPFQPWQLSDGSIRFICLATALLQPDPPSLVVIDEPELGLHPHALGLVGDLIQKASATTQVVVATQSAALLSGFDPADVVVVSSREGASEFRRLGADELLAFLEDYSLGDLWQKNYIDGASNG